MNGDPREMLAAGMIVSGLMRDGWTEVAAIQHVRERFGLWIQASAAIQRRDGGDCHPLGAHHDQAIQKVPVLHGAHHPTENDACPTNQRSGK